MIPVISTFPPTPKITLCSVLWRFCELWPQDKSIGAAATVRYQDKSSGVPEAPHHWPWWAFVLHGPCNLQSSAT